MNKQKITYHILSSTIVVAFDGKSVVVEKNSDTGKVVLEKIKTGELDQILDMIDFNQQIKNRSNNFFEIIDNQIYSYGDRIPDVIAIKIFKFIEQNEKFEYLINFWNRVKENPSENSKNQLFLFLSSNNFPITEDGCFIAYKRVKWDYTDLRTGKMDNSIGKVVKMERSEVVDDPMFSCAAGLHIAPYSYALTYAKGKLIEVKVSPKDVVSVPVSYHDQKARVCEYLVVGEIDDPENYKFDNTKITYTPITPVSVEEAETDNFIEAFSEFENLDPTPIKKDIVKIVLPVKDNTPTVISNKKKNVKKNKIDEFFCKVGNISYKIRSMTSNELKSVISNELSFSKIKRSKYPKVFCNMWNSPDITKDDSISTIHRVSNSSNIWNYIIKLKDNRIFVAEPIK